MVRKFVTDWPTFKSLRLEHDFVQNLVENNNIHNKKNLFEMHSV